MAPAERYAYDEHLNAIMIQNDVLSTAKLEGLTEGRSKGLAEGRAEGLAEGREEALLSTARNLKAMGLSEASHVGDFLSGAALGFAYGIMIVDLLYASGLLGRIRASSELKKKKD